MAARHLTRQFRSPLPHAGARTYARTHAQVFMNTATVGASADVGKLTSSAAKRLLGPAAFLFTGENRKINKNLENEIN